MLINAALARVLAGLTLPAIAVCVDPTRPDSRYVTDAANGTVIDANPSVN